MSTTTSSLALAAALLAAGMTSVVSAQARQDEPKGPEVRRPYRGIFGAQPNPDAAQSLVLTGSAYGAYDDNVLAGLSGRNQSVWWLQRPGYYQAASVGLDYTLAKQTPRFTVGGHSAGQARYYHRSDQSEVVPYYQGDFSVDTRLSRSVTFSVLQAAAYMPHYTLSLTPTAGDDLGVISPRLDPDLDLFPLRAFRATTMAALSQRFGRSTSLTGGYLYRYVDVDDSGADPAVETPFHDYQTHAAFVRARHSRRLTTHASLDLGYGVKLQDRRSGNGEPRVLHNVNAGISYGRALSFSRRTSFSFSTGSAIVSHEDALNSQDDVRTRARFIGNAALTHEMGRTWTASAVYQRGFVFRDGFDDPYFIDAATASLNGLVTRRLSFSASFTAYLAELERRGSNRHNGRSANVHASYALNQFFALFARYVYYEYEYGEDIPLDSRFPRTLDRQGIRVGLTASVPLLR